MLPQGTYSRNAVDFGFQRLSMQSISLFDSACFSSPDILMCNDAVYESIQQSEKQSFVSTAHSLPCNLPTASLQPHHEWRESCKTPSGHVDGFMQTSGSSIIGCPSHQIHQTRDPENPRRPNQPGIASTFQKLTMQKPEQFNESFHYHPVIGTYNVASHFDMNGPPLDRSHIDQFELPMYCRTESAPSCLDYARAQISLELNEEFPHSDPTFISGEVMRTCSAPLPYTARTHTSKRQSSIDDYLALERPRRRSIREFISVLSDDPPGGMHPRPQQPHLMLEGQLPTVCKVTSTARHIYQSAAVIPTLLVGMCIEVWHGFHSNHSESTKAQSPKRA